MTLQISAMRPVVETTGRALHHSGQRKDYPLGGIPVEYKGGTVPPPDQRRSYN